MFALEGNINFYEELNKEDNNNDYDENVCLITQLPLSNDYIELKCGHKFNYEPLYNDIVNHKTKFNKLEKKTLGIYEIRCPYCRTIQKKLLPPNELYENIHGVNYVNTDLLLYNIHKDYLWTKGKCMYTKDLSNNIYECTNDTITYLELFDLSLCLTHKNEYQYNYFL